jgi:catechol 2,3-dioxygenase-like lactoylglutathione lyase family enzyme
VLAGADIVAFGTTADPERARRFYADTLELPMLEQTPYALVFRAPNAVLRVAVSDHVVAAPYTVLGWVVHDIAATVDGLAARGVDFERFEGMEQDSRGVWRSSGGARIAWFRDPDGNLLSLTQQR